MAMDEDSKPNPKRKAADATEESAVVEEPKPSRFVPTKVTIVANARKYGAALELQQYNTEEEARAGVLQVINLVGNTLYQLWQENPRRLEATITLDVEEN